MAIKPTPNTLFTMSNSDLLNNLRDVVLVDIPNGVNSEGDLKRIEYLLGKLANDYSYLVSMTGYARNFTRQLKRKGTEFKNDYEDMMDKRDTLEGVASAVKMQYQAVSRMLTAKIQISEENNLHDYRKEK